MKKKKILTMVAAVALVAVIGVGATLAYFTDKDSKTNVVTMGKVDIKLDEPEFSKNPADTITDVKPNQTIVKDPKITVEGGSLDAYVRAKIEFKDLNEAQISDILPGIDIKNEEWYYSEADGYYYYQKKMSAKDSVYLFQSVKIPEKWGNEVSGLTFKINVFAEAIQADSFTPERNSEDVITGWKDSENNNIVAETNKTETTEATEQQ